MSRFERVSDLQRLRAEWSELAAESRNVYATWEWASHWIEHVASGRPVSVVAVREVGGDLIAIFPFQLEPAVPVRMLRFIGHGPVCRPEHTDAALDLLPAALEAASRGWDVFVGDLPADEGLSGREGWRCLSRFESPFIQNEHDGWEGYLRSRSKNLRSQVRKSERRLQRKHSLRHRLSTDPAMLDSDFELLVSLHRARWGQRGSGYFAGPRGRFHRAFAGAAQEQGWLRLWIMELDGRPVAARYGLRYHGVEWFLQAGRDPSLRRERVGFVALNNSIRNALQEGVEEIRFGRGGEWHKQRLATGSHALETVAVARGPLGRAVVRLGPGARSRLRRIRPGPRPRA